jgi:twitching motility two-component system response regulator PilH
VAHILVIDDSPTEVHALRTMLERNHYQVTAASSGEDGIKLARELKPDLILMDVVMPGLNGFQATRQLSREPATANIPIIIVSTKGQQTDKIWASRQGARGYLVRPFKEAELLGSIRLTLSA